MPGASEAISAREWASSRAKTARGGEEPGFNELQTAWLSLGLVRFEGALVSRRTWKRAGAKRC